MDRLIRPAAKVSPADWVSKQPALRRPPRPLLNVTWLTLAIAGVHSMSVSRLLSLSVGLLLLGTGGAHAEGGCPAGEYPVGGQGWQGCNPIPGSGNNRAPQQSAEVWQERYGAIAVDGPNKATGSSVNMRSDDAARDAAIADCRSKGGEDCAVELPFRNGCAAVATGDEGHNASARQTITEASTAALKVCVASGDTNCRVYYSACSLPVRIR